ncbi:hypothetical protein ACFWDI_17430 [Streptomyces sp. NPDC060064]|uniref:hypothetical protein n=1 Tax=Streptomyces sp. NPDC060064 TaxID=3347049 RepID=UPI0036C00E50
MTPIRQFLRAAGRAGVLPAAQDIGRLRLCVDPNCGCHGCNDERYRFKDAFITSDNPVLGESVSIGPIGELILWAQSKSFEHPDEKDQLYCGVNLSYGTAWTVGGEC